MLLNSIFLKNFRNYGETLVEINNADSIFLIGKNGQGKTNFLEALYFLSYGNSFKAKKEEQVIKHKESFYKLKGLLNKDNIKHTIDIFYTKNKKKILYDGNLIKNRKDILHNFPTLIFKHSDIFFVSGSPEHQRLYLDQILVLNHSEYVLAFQQYKKILNQKNAALKQENFEIISIYNEQLAFFGSTIVFYRKKIIDYINRIISTMFNSIFGEFFDIKLKYFASWGILEDDKMSFIENIKKILKSQFNQELRYKTSVSGPHRDNIKIMIGEHEFKNIASTGQIRIVSLILRSIQALYYKEESQKTMIYLFDDVLLELDIEKQIRFIEKLPKSQQSFFTFLPDKNFSSIVKSNKKKYFQIEQGKIIET